MRNEDFKTLVTLLERDAHLLRNFMIEGASSPRLQTLLSERARNYVAAVPKETRLENALLHKDDAAGRWSGEMLGQYPNCAQTEAAGCDVTCGPSCATTTCGGTCGSTTAIFLTEMDQLAALRLSSLEGVSCDETTTCSCTTGTCGGATCGGSTCSVTCSGDSCGNTCGDSCGTTTNISRAGDVFTRPWQFDRWR